MKINFDMQFFDLEGRPIKMSAADKTDLTLKRVAVDALLGTHAGEENIDGTEKLARFKLAQRISVGGEIELTVDDAKKIKDLVGTMYVPMIVGQAWPALDGA